MPIQLGSNRICTETSPTSDSCPKRYKRIGWRHFCASLPEYRKAKPIDRPQSIHEHNRTTRSPHQYQYGQVATCPLSPATYPVSPATCPLLSLSYPSFPIYIPSLPKPIPSRLRDLYMH